jgi:hypothetical protein
MRAQSAEVAVIGRSLCGGSMRWAEVAKTESAASRLMVKLGLAPHPPPARQATPLGQLSLEFYN